MSQIQPYRRIRTTNLELNEVQDAVVDTINSLSPNPFLVGEILQVFLTTGSANEIQHKLNKIPEGFIIIDLDALAVVYRDATEIKFLDKFIEGNQL